MVKKGMRRWWVVHSMEKAGSVLRSRIGLEGMVSLGSSYSQPQQPCEGVYASSTATATAAGSRGAPPITHNPGHSGFRLPKWAAYAAIALVIAGGSYTAAAKVTNLPPFSRTQQSGQVNSGGVVVPLATPAPTATYTCKLCPG